jgi:diguanylate cyclase (GGDEF)-like protein
MSERARLLVVDDEPVILEALIHLLEADYEICVATNGADALPIAEAAHPDLILLDLMMPDMNGYEVFGRLKQTPTAADIGVMFITACRDSADETNALEMGAVDFVSKPINAAALKLRVRNQIELKRARETMARLATTDGLTGLANRRRFDEVLAAECGRLGRTQSLLSLVMLDIDYFKQFNDRYGHVAGDECLRNVGVVIADAVHRGPDLGARYGGEEFVCILPGTEAGGAASVAQRIRDGVSRLAIPHAGSCVSSQVTVSMGVATVICGPGMDQNRLLVAADGLLYRAKAAGRNTIVVGTPCGVVPT